MVWRVPKEAEAEVDEFWNSHENFMRKCHVMAKSVGDNPQVDGKSRLTGYVIGKGEEMIDSFNPGMYRYCLTFCQKPIEQFVSL